ncbi:MAG: hypothetical protein GWN99_11315 [Gemmatimonadetes bacterium]|uniref:Uncharacterized protein n=1 Tax=Candidatus Kutchimonas denitrificans TaxID=3056748 RepID=A0AAE5CA21_9BACT|nr:hypothetical protein [Gemmatimonadota bacterium]NIR74072.1 hypothetical protein [Candidatus Kutchimonas denitrificans]NIS01634.1 hypothetical protein [Gemmatimonadota bacterium]NIT67372.1 hypothetical protein [Gemmatimonadota bacterium]NIU52735.1 hypothetical protein [Gemmatimonadota bacterium]
MLIVLFAFVVVSAIVIHHFAVERRRARQAEEVRAEPVPVPASGMLGGLPAGSYLSPGFTWCRKENGELHVGAHPMLLRLVGAPYELEVAADRGRVGKGEPLIRIKKGHRSLTLPAPVAGQLKGRRRIAAVGSDESDAWLCCMEPEDLDETIPTWMSGDEAERWTERRYDEIREHFLRAGVDDRLGVTLADGGDLPVGVLGELDETRWRDFSDTFLRE